MALTNARDITPAQWTEAVRLARDLVAADLSERSFRLGPVARGGQAQRAVVQPPDKLQPRLAELVRSIEAMPELEPGDDIGGLPSGMMKIANSVAAHLAKNPPALSEQRKVGAIEGELLALQGMANLHLGAQATRDHRLVDRLVDKVLSALGIEATGAARHRVGEAVLRGAGEAYAEAMDQTRGTPRSLAELDEDLLRHQRLTAASATRAVQISEAPAAAAREAPAGAASSMPLAQGPLFSELYEAFCQKKERTGKWRESSSKHGRLAGRLFSEAFDAIRITEIRKKTAADFAELLKGMPEDWKDRSFYWKDTKTRSFRPIREIVERTKARTDPWTPLSLVTQRRHLGFLQMFWEEMLSEIDDEPEPWHQDVRTRKSPFRDFVPTKAQVKAVQLPEDARQAFSIADMHKLLLGDEPLKHKPKTPGELTRFPHRYFALLIAAYSGMRLGEICQLRCQDIKQVGSIWVMDVLPYRFGKPEQNSRTLSGQTTLKTETSERMVPIHPVLLRQGFIDFVEARKARIKTTEPKPTEKRPVPDLLFYELTWDPNNQDFIRKASRWFTDYRRMCLGVRPNEKLDFHSFRHTVRTVWSWQAGKAGLELPRDKSINDVIDDVMGHSRPGSTGERIYQKQVNLIPYHKILCALSYGIAEHGEDPEIPRILAADGMMLAQ